MNVLIVAIEERSGLARLPKFLQGAGFQCGVLCHAAHPLAHTKYAARHFLLPRTTSSHRLAGALHAAMDRWQPHLIIPGDEQVVAFLQALLRDMPAEGRGRWPAAMLAVLERSLGAPAQRHAMLFKNKTQELAKAIGVRTPPGSRVRSRDEAAALADALRYPVVLKTSFSWAGNGVTVCNDRAALLDAYDAMAPKAARDRHLAYQWAHQWVRTILGRAWYPAPEDLWVQTAIAGDPAMYTLTAHGGRALAGFAGRPLSTSSATGPSTVVEFGPHAEMQAAATRMVEALGATGFISFDFMIERATGMAYLLECNPRPNQVSHLGERVGVDLCSALMSGLRVPAGAHALPALAATRSDTVALFPQEWRRAANSSAITQYYHDVPWDDPRLVERIIAASAALNTGAVARGQIRARLPRLASLHSAT